MKRPWILGKLPAATLSTAPPPVEAAYTTFVKGFGPLAYWPLGSNLVDVIGGRDATMGGGQEQHASPIAQGGEGSLSCNNVNWAQVAHDVALKPGIGSVMAWIRPYVVDAGAVLAANLPGDTNAADFASLLTATGLNSCYFQQDASTQLIVSSTQTYSENTPQCIIVIFDASGFAFYLDANQIDSNTVHTDGLTGNTTEWRFGGDGGSALLLPGDIADVALWNRVLTRTEIYQLAQTEPSS